MSVPDALIWEAVEKIFKEVDLDRSSSLNLREVICLLNMGLRAMGRKGNATFHDAE
jgi:hypothetical protein